MNTVTPAPYRAYTPLRQLPPGTGAPPRRQFMPRSKYEELVRRAQELLPVLDAPPLDWALAQRAHDPEYLARWRAGRVTHDEELALGFKWTPELVRRAELACGGTLQATLDALDTGWSVNLAGGTHHAHHDRPGGFSFVNDVVIATRYVLDTGLARRVLILDLDVHQGNGTAAMLRHEPRAFTLSVHAERNYPFRKESSDLDIGLPDGTRDEAYLSALDRAALPAASAFRPDLVYHLAGADVLAGDQLGRLALTVGGLRTRDERVATWAARNGISLVTITAGGYNRDPDLLIAARLATLHAGLTAMHHARDTTARPKPRTSPQEA